MAYIYPIISFVFISLSFCLNNPDIFDGEGKVIIRDKKKPIANPKKKKSNRGVQNVLDGIDIYNRWWAGTKIETLFQRKIDGENHNRTSNVILTSLFGGIDPYLVTKIDIFMGSARKIFSGDIVVIVNEDILTTDIRQKFILEYNLIIYTISNTICQYLNSNHSITQSDSVHDNILCGSADEKVPASVFKYFLYEILVSFYSEKVFVIIADLTQTYFQRNPFVFMLSSRKYFQKSQIDKQLFLFLEFHPNSILNRNEIYNKLGIECYGTEVYQRIAHLPIINPYTFFGSRDGILLWSHRLSQELQDAPGRYSDGTCNLASIESIFIQSIVYSGRLRSQIRMSLVHHGEGAVNSLWGLLPESNISRARTSGIRLAGPLDSFWRILDTSTGWVHNWNGDVAPIVSGVCRVVHELRHISNSSEDSHYRVSDYIHKNLFIFRLFRKFLRQKLYC